MEYKAASEIEYRIVFQTSNDAVVSVVVINIVAVR